MSDNTQQAQFCPICGTALASAAVCPQCGSNPAAPPKEEKNRPDSTQVYGPPLWQKVEHPLKAAWPWLWRATGVIGLGLWVWSLVRLFNFRFWFLVTFLLCTAALALYGWKYYVMTSAFKENEYYFLLNDAYPIGKFRIPKLLVVAFAIDFGLYLWGGLLILIPAVFMLFAGPVQIQWRIGHKPQATKREKKLPKAKTDAPTAVPAKKSAPEPHEPQ